MAQHHYADLGAVRLHYVEAGQGPLVLLLHGFPECWYSYRHQLPALAAAGYRAVAPDLRGYNLSDKPKGVAAYTVDRLVDDVECLIEALGAKRAVVVGHDWGGVVAWAFAMRYPERTAGLVILNAPHPVAVLRGLWRPLQWLRSAYVLFFQLPWLPEAVLRTRGFAAIRRTLEHDPRSGVFGPDDIQRYVNALNVPGALTAGLNYYRALRLRSLRAGLRRIDAPVLVVWGERDRYLGPELAEPPAKWVPNQRVVRLLEASHWVQNERPAEINRLLVEFLAERGYSARE